MTIDPRSPFGLLLTAICIVAFAYLILPILVVVVAPLGDTAYLAFPPQGFTLRWYAAALDDTRYLGGFLTSLQIGAAVALLSTIIGVLAAYGLSRYDFPGRSLIEALFLSPLILPTLVLAVSLSLFFTRTGLLTGTGRLILAHIVVCTPYVIRVTLPVLRRFDRTLEEAAQNLGASPIQSFFLILLPVIKTGIIAGCVMAFITSFDEVVLALFLASPGEPTLPVMIYSAVQLGFEPTVAAVSGLLVILTCVFMVLYQILGVARQD
jgi:putative spermidine/putrescine transport system permease protein